jgi:hypothetical protein
MLQKLLLEDLEGFLPNKYFSGNIELVMRGYKKWAYKHNGKVKAVVCYKRQEDELLSFFLISCDFTARDAVYLRKAIDWLQDRVGGNRAWTLSESCQQIKDWHNFLGLKLEKENCTIQGNINYDLWVKEG